MSNLNIEWFKNKIEKTIDNFVEKMLSEKLRNIESGYNLKIVELQDEKPFVSAIQSGDTLVVLLKDGRALTKTGISIDDLNSCRTEKDLIDLMIDKDYQKAKEQDLELVNSINILTNTGQFKLVDNSVYMIGVNRSIPRLLILEFAKLLEILSFIENYNEESVKEDYIIYTDRYNGLKKFWLKCCLNPNANSAEDLFKFLKTHVMKIDKHGNFYAYRRVETIESNSELVDFISNAYNKVKAVWKKKVSDFEIFDDNGLVLAQGDKRHDYNNHIGNLKELYLDLPNLSTNRYTDNYTKEEDYRVGAIHSMPRHKGNDNNSISCSKGFHAASSAYDYSAFGDTDILVIINPIDVLAVPLNEDGKLRTCRWFFAMTLSENEKYILNEDGFDVTYLGDVFEEKCSENLEDYVKNGFAEEVQRHTFTLPSLSTVDIKSMCDTLSELKNQLQNRVVKG